MRKEVNGGYIEYRLPSISEATNLSLEIKKLSAEPEDSRNEKLFLMFLGYLPKFVTAVDFEDKKCFADVEADMSCMNIVVELVQSISEGMNVPAKKKVYLKK